MQKVGFEKKGERCGREEEEKERQEWLITPLAGGYQQQQQEGTPAVSAAMSYLAEREREGDHGRKGRGWKGLKQQQHEQQEERINPLCTQNRLTLRGANALVVMGVVMMSASLSWQKTSSSSSAHRCDNLRNSN